MATSNAEVLPEYLKEEPPQNEIAGRVQAISVALNEVEAEMVAMHSAQLA